MFSLKKADGIVPQRHNDDNNKNAMWGGGEKVKSGQEGFRFGKGCSCWLTAVERFG